MKKLEVILIRHCETDYNKDRRFAGITDVGINKKGTKQAKLLKNKLKNEKIDIVYSSNLTRCRETLEIINIKSEVVYSKNLQEMDFGVWEGLTYEEAEKNHGELVLEWKKDWINYTIPKGESFSIMSKRLIDEFEIIKNKHSGKIAVISHGGCIRAILGHYLMDSIKECWKFYVENGSVSRLSFDDKFVYLKSLNEG